MPQLDGSYPSFGVEHQINGLEGLLVPQISVDFATMSDGALVGQMTNGTCSLDPAAFVDLHSEITGGVAPTVSGGLWTNSSPMAISWANIRARASGSGFEVGIRPSFAGSSSWSIQLRVLDNSNSGYVAELNNSTHLLSLSLVVAGSSSPLKTLSFSSAVDNLFTFFWGGGSRFRVGYGESFFSETDDTINILDATLSVVTSGVPVASITAGASHGMDGFDVTPPQRDVTNIDILMYDGINYPWPVVDATPIDGTDPTILDNAISLSGSLALNPFITLAYAPPELQASDATPGGAPVGSRIIDNWVSVVEAHPEVRDFIIWKRGLGMECGIDSGSTYFDATPRCALGDWDLSRYGAMFFYSEIELRAANPLIRLYGPNHLLAERGEGFDTSCNGTMVDSRDIGFLQAFVDAANAATPFITPDGIAVCGDYTSGEWTQLVPYLKTMVGDLPLVITATVNAATPTQDDINELTAALNDVLDVQDKVFVELSGLFFDSPRLTVNDADWVFTGTLQVPYLMKNAKLKVVTISDTVLLNGSVIVQGDAATPYYLADDLPVGNGALLLGNLQEGTYLFTISGDKGVNGTGVLRIGVYSDNFETVTIADTKYLGSA